jgi:hypothetical protein
MVGFMVRCTLLALAALFCAFGCGHAPTAQERWFADRGRVAPTWHTCLQIGAELRAACGSDATCGSEATRTMSRACYAGRYRQETSHATPRGVVRAERLSPCFWHTDAPKVTAADYMQRTCSGVVEANLRSACVAELREVIEGICTEGALDLTGAGP